MRTQVERRYGLPDRGRIEPRLWLGTGLTLLIAELYNAYSIDLHVLVAGTLLPAADLAVLNAALRTLALVAFSSAAVGVAFAPKVSPLFEDGRINELRRATRHAFHLALWPAVGIVALLVVFGRPVLGLFGPVYVDGYGALVIAAIAQVLVAASVPLVPLLSMTGNQAALLRVSTGTVIVAVLAHLALTSTFGIRGASMAIVASSLYWTGALVWHVRSRVDRRLVPLLP